jgi:hypothetical protein
MSRRKVSRIDLTAPVSVELNLRTGGLDGVRRSLYTSTEELVVKLGKGRENSLDIGS